MICISCILAWGIPLKSNAEDLCFKNISSARNAATDLLKGRYSSEKLPVITLQRDLLKIKTDDLEKISLNKDTEIKIYKSQSDEYKVLYTDTARELNDIKTKIPSRYTWFTAGVLATIVAFTIGFFAIK